MGQTVVISFKNGGVLRWRFKLRLLALFCPAARAAGWINGAAAAAAAAPPFISLSLSSLLGTSAPWRTRSSSSPESCCTAASKRGTTPRPSGAEASARSPRSCRAHACRSGPAFSSGSRSRLPERRVEEEGLRLLDRSETSTSCWEEEGAKARALGFGGKGSRVVLFCFPQPPPPLPRADTHTHASTCSDKSLFVRMRSPGGNGWRGGGGGASGL